MLLLSAALSSRALDSLQQLYPEIRPYILAAKATLKTTPPGEASRILREICSLKDKRPCRLACNRLAGGGSPAVKVPPCPKTYPVLKYLYRKTRKVSYLADLGRLYPRTKEAKKLLKLPVSKKLKLRVMLAHGMWDSVLKAADTTDPEEYGLYLVAKWKRRGVSFSEVLKMPPEYRKRALIKHLVRFLNAEDYDSISLALLELIRMGDYRRAYRVMASEVAKPFLRYEASDLYARISATAYDGLDPESFVWLGLSAYGVHYLEDAYNYFYEARKRAERGSFVWTQATYWLYLLSRDTNYVRDLRTYNPISYYYLELSEDVPWKEGDVWDTAGNLRNYEIGKVMEKLWGWSLAYPWYVKDVPSGYRRARELMDEGNFLKASYVLAGVYRVADKGRGVPLWWGRMAFPYTLYGREIDSAAKEFGIDPLFLRAIVREESRFKRKARSRAGAMGLAQIMPFNVRRFRREMKERVRDPYAPLTNLRMGAFLLREAFQIYRSPHLVAAAYNAGRGALDRWLCRYGYELLNFPHFIDVIPYSETRKYVRRVIRSYRAYRSLYGRGFPGVK